MIGTLPEYLEVGGKSYKINADFRNVLTIFDAFSDDKLTDSEKAFVCIKRLYVEEIPHFCIEKAIRKAYWFCEGGDMPKSTHSSQKVIDWKHDEQMIFPAVSKVLNVVDVRSLSFLHWWTFLGSFGEVGEGLFSTVMSIRQKRAKGQKLAKYERDFLKRNRDLVVLRTEEEEREIAETEAFLATIT